MATNARPGRPGGAKNRDKDENIAKAAGAVIGAGIAWSLFRSITGKVKLQQNKSDTLSKQNKHAKDAEHTGSDIKGTVEAPESKFSHFGFHKKLDGKTLGKTVQVRDGDTLWGLARKYNVSVDALMASNGIKDGDSIAAGELIVLPKPLKP